MLQTTTINRSMLKNIFKAKELEPDTSHLKLRGLRIYVVHIQSYTFTNPSQENNLYRVTLDMIN